MQRKRRNLKNASLDRDLYGAPWLVAALALLWLCAPVGALAAERKGPRTWSTGAKIVATDLGFAPGTLVIVNRERSLYHVLGKGKSKRYRIAVGARDELWTGRTFVSMKRKNPLWIPLDGSKPIAGGSPDNPLGKRALYLDWSLLRIHGTSNPRSIGGAVSNGCIRMFNEDVIELYDAVHIGAPVVAINAPKDAGEFEDAGFTGKRPAWRGQSKIWSARQSAESRALQLLR